MGIDTLVNQGGAPAIDIANQTIHNDRYWKGFFPKGHVLNAMSSAIFTGFKKEFHKQDGKYTGVTSDTDDRIHARNSLEEITVGHRSDGTLEAGNYILLRYLDPPWQGFYDVFKIINEDLMIGRVYLGEYPNGVRVFTFPMSRRYGFDQMTVDDHAGSFSPPAASHRRRTGWRLAHGCDFQRQPSRRNRLPAIQQQAGRRASQARYQLMGLMEGLVAPSFLKDHFQLNDFTPFHDEIRKVSRRFPGRQVCDRASARLAPLFANSSLGTVP